MIEGVGGQKTPPDLMQISCPTNTPPITIERPPIHNPEATSTCYTPPPAH